MTRLEEIYETATDDEKELLNDSLGFMANLIYETRNFKYFRQCSERVTNNVNFLMFCSKIHNQKLEKDNSGDIFISWFLLTRVEYKRLLRFEKINDKKETLFDFICNKSEGMFVDELAAVMGHEMLIDLQKEIPSILHSKFSSCFELVNYIKIPANRNKLYIDIIKNYDESFYKYVYVSSNRKKTFIMRMREQIIALCEKMLDIALADWALNDVGYIFDLSRKNNKKKK